eukprot:747919-Hanusia_phi.AAC.5
MPSQSQLAGPAPTVAVLMIIKGRARHQFCTGKTRIGCRTVSDSTANHHGIESPVPRTVRYPVVPYGYGDCNTAPGPHRHRSMVAGPSECTGVLWRGPVPRGPTGYRQ